MHLSAISFTASATSNANVLISDSGKAGTKLNTFPPALVYFSVAKDIAAPVAVFLPSFKIFQYNSRICESLKHYSSDL